MASYRNPNKGRVYYSFGYVVAGWRLDFDNAALDPDHGRLGSVTGT